MAYYGNHRRGSYRRRRNSGALWRFVALALVLAVCATAVVQTIRATGAVGEADGLRAQVKNLQDQLDKVGDTVPEAVLTDALKGEALPYQTLYPEMKVDGVPEFAENNPRAVYLTFDDGPSANTATILDALRDTKQKATFFVVGKNIPGNEAVLKRITDEGHTIGVHSYSHDYNAIYASVDAFMEDFHQTYQAIYDVCGVYPTVFRFPGGSINAYNRGVYQQIIAEMLRRGFVYYDWSVSSEDAANKKYTANQIASFVIDGVGNTNHAIVLMHDAADKTNTAKAVPTIISTLFSAGYSCERLTNEVRPVTFSYAE